MQSSSTLARPEFKSSTESGNFLRVLLVALKYTSLVALIALLGMALQSPMGFRVVAAGSIFVLLILLIRRFPKLGIICTFSFLVIIGGVRRWLIPDFGWLSFDPLILICPVISLLFFTSLIVERKIPSDTTLSRCVKFLLLIMAIQIVNPLQGGLLVGVGGILYYIVPLLWFYVGRQYGNPKNGSEILQVAVVAFTLTGIYGLKQVFFGISASEKAWVDASGYVALNMSEGAIRVFSTFASTQEYAVTLACAISVCAVFIMHRKLQYIFPLLILFPALLYTGTRGPVATALLAVSLQWAFLGRKRAVWLPRLSLALFIGVVGLFWSLSRVSTSGLSVQQSAILSHQQNGLLNPTESTGPAHILTVVVSIVDALKKPYGIGLGATTMAASKLGAGNTYSSEFDLSNLFISLGVVGGALYGYVLYLTYKNSLAMWSQTRNITYLLTIGLLTVCIGQWLNGGLYSLCFLIWFLIGMMDRSYAANPANAVPTSEKNTVSSLSARWKHKKSAQAGEHSDYAYPRSSSDGHTRLARNVRNDFGRSSRSLPHKRY